MVQFIYKTLHLGMSARDARWIKLLGCNKFWPVYWRVRLPWYWIQSTNVKRNEIIFSEWTCQFLCIHHDLLCCKFWRSLLVFLVDFSFEKFLDLSSSSYDLAWFKIIKTFHSISTCDVVVVHLYDKDIR